MLWAEFPLPLLRNMLPTQVNLPTLLCVCSGYWLPLTAPPLGSSLRAWFPYPSRDYIAAICDSSAKLTLA